MKNFVTIAFLLSILVGCESKKEQVNQELKDCINENVLNHINNIQEFAEIELTEKDNFDLFDSISKFEDRLISKNILKSKSEKDYKELINAIGSNLISTQSINSIYEKNSFIAYISENSLTNSAIYNSCPWKIIEKEKSKRLVKSKDVFDKIMIKGYSDFVPEIKEYSELIDYKSDIERLLLTNLIYIYLDTSFWNTRQFPDLKEGDDGLFYEN